MEAVRVFLVVLCAVVIGGSGVFGSGVVGYGSGLHSSRDIASQSSPRARFSWGRYDGQGNRYDGQGAKASAVIRAAQQEVGVREVVQNTGKRVDEYNACVGLNRVAWCASFVSFCFKQAGYSQPRTAWSPALFPEGRCRTEALPGMVMGIYFPDLKRIAHCGIVSAVRGDWCETIEGNTNVDGSREGVGVFLRVRHKRSIAKFSDWLN